MHAAASSVAIRKEPDGRFRDRLDDASAIAFPELLHGARTIATAHFNTHELGFAYHVADRAIFLHEGLLHEQGTPQEVLLRPREQRTREFLEGHGLFRLPEPEAV